MTRQELKEITMFPALLIPAVVKLGEGLIDRFFPDPEKKAQALFELEKMRQTGELAELTASTDLAKLQIQTNIEEAKTGNFFIAGWRPAVGWIAVAGICYQVVFRPVIGWLMENTAGWSMPPTLELETLMTLLFGILGLGAYRTAEKIKGAEGNR
jgi:Holin of 3TMs, for gene-transfer release